MSVRSSSQGKGTHYSLSHAFSYPDFEDVRNTTYPPIRTLWMVVPLSCPSRPPKSGHSGGSTVLVGTEFCHLIEPSFDGGGLEAGVKRPPGEALGGEASGFQFAGEPADDGRGRADQRAGPGDPLGRGCRYGDFPQAKGFAVSVQHEETRESVDTPHLTPLS